MNELDNIDEGEYIEETGPNGKYERRQIGIIQKYRELKDKLSVVVFFFDVITDLIEKLNKLLGWQN